ncbi:UDP-N-acetylmuramoyl-tripeptide--D-alanyl-D-alanine ligase [Bacillus lacus]|uniref:UDP-N-acetylmuramoyl-tripeptide--D-alanyl-D-alanine ligase n=1 Tax=Metabacillus lacus TaxID=1983721 RepID=A0A7X2IYN8_9BACI|nr:UDP-N-acetylmuramoyl-tripeptide--D-alanyl-D-alanine ligase [Metabacillus lacus]MRX72100.1 UDP-N-acetylmuramoyl-tripeptide--D-alanyl-D-alanine ligase [Metabacillus lacus]
MIIRSLKEVQEMSGGKGLKQSDESIMLNGVTTDSRSIVEGSLFIPLIGEKFNGHTFAEKALSEGAAAVLWQEGQPNPPSDGPVIFVQDTLSALQQLAGEYRRQIGVKVVGVTGSNGKTTTKDLIAAVAGTKYTVHKTKGNFNNHIGLPLTLLEMNEDTEVAVLEMGMSARGEISTLSKLAEPDIAVITNIGESHLMDLGSREGIAEAKLEIIEGLHAEGVFIYIGDEPLLQERITWATQNCITFGEDEENQLYPVSVESASNGMTFTVNDSSQEFYVPILGRHNVLNSLAALAAGRSLGITDEEAAKGLRALEMTRMRLEMSESKEGYSIINDAYNASPTSMKAGISLTEDMGGYHRKILILGDMLELGEKEEDFHREVGEFINPEKTSLVITYGKLGKNIAEGALKKLGEERVFSFEDKAELISFIQNTAASGDLLYLKASRAMKLEEVVEAVS